jgi:DNA polymerase
MGESEFVLDGMSVAEALGTIDKLRSSKPAPQSRQAAAKPQAPIRAKSADAPSRSAKTPARTPQSAAPARVESPVVPYVTTPTEPTPPPAPIGDAELAAKFAAGLVIGNANGTLFQQNPYHNVDSLVELAKLIEACRLCQLCETARHSVPGDGNPAADFMCIGEAPGANEDETGHPFVGQAGGLLTKILAAIDLTREQVFITNVLKHRPPANRNPQPGEVEVCSPYLVRQIQLVNPKVILALGTFAAQTLLATKTPIGKLRGAVHRYYGIPLIVTYHPAALLRNPAWKRPTWEDVKLARLVLDNSKS